MKNLIKYHSINRILLSPFHLQNTFNKKNLLNDKGSCQLIIDMPKNYFLYNERIE